MLAPFRTLAVSRVAAACVALALSGAPALASALARPAARACACAAHGKGTRCCHGCHGGSRAAKHAGEERGCPKDACGSVSGGCGTPEARTSPPRGFDDFTLTDAVALGTPGRAAEIAPPAASPRDVEQVPELPPPRRAA